MRSERRVRRFMRQSRRGIAVRQPLDRAVEVVFRLDNVSRAHEPFVWNRPVFWRNESARTGRRRARSRRPRWNERFPCVVDRGVRLFRPCHACRLRSSRLTHPAPALPSIRRGGISPRDLPPLIEGGAGRGASVLIISHEWCFAHVIPCSIHLTRAQAVIEFEIKHARQEATPIELLVNHQPIATVSAVDWTTVRLSAPVLKSVANALFGIVLLPLMQPNEDEDTVAVLVFFGSLPQIPLVLPA